MITTALHGVGTWNMGAAEWKILNVYELRYLRGMVGVTLMNQVRNDEMQRRTVVVIKLADRAE